jgi:hypothetical protein
MPTLACRHLANAHAPTHPAVCVLQRRPHKCVEDAVEVVAKRILQHAAQLCAGLGLQVPAVPPEPRKEGDRFVLPLDADRYIELAKIQLHRADEGTLQVINQPRVLQM